MADSKYSKYIVTELKAPFPAEMMAAHSHISKRVLWIDDRVVPGSFQMNFSWYLQPILRGPGPHTHDVGEILGFYGSDPDDPYNLHGEVEVWLGDQPQTITSTAMVYIPPGLKHCPLTIKRVDKPIIHFSVVTTGKWSMDNLKETHKPETDYSKYVVRDLRFPFPPKLSEEYKKFATRILWMDKGVIPGAFQMNTAWYCKPQAHAPTGHKHSTDEIIGFVSSDLNNPYDLGGEIEFWLEDEKFMLTKSCFIFAPAGMTHCPLIIHKTTRPVFHFSILTGGTYEHVK